MMTEKSKGPQNMAHSTSEYFVSMICVVYQSGDLISV